jgi:hypothetical protein
MVDPPAFSLQEGMNASMTIAHPDGGNFLDTVSEGAWSGLRDR